MVAHIPIEVGIASGEADWVLADEAAHLGGVPTVPTVLQCRRFVEVLARVTEDDIGRQSRALAIPKRIVRTVPDRGLASRRIEVRNVLDRSLMV
jgi:hypothetical protein